MTISWVFDAASMQRSLTRQSLRASISERVDEFSRAGQSYLHAEERERVMTIEHVLAVVAVSDLPASRDWYSSLLGRQPDNDPMPTLTEWQVLPKPWLHVIHDPDRAGSSLSNLAAADLEARAADLEGRGLRPEPVVEATKGVKLSTVSDPDGNLIRLIGGFRVEY